MIESILSLCQTDVNEWQSCAKANPHIHNVVKDHKCGASCLLLVANTYLAYASVSTKQIVQVFASNLVIEVLDEQNPIRAGRQLCLRKSHQH